MLSFENSATVSYISFPSLQSFWDIVTEITHSDVITQINNLVVNTKAGTCRVCANVCADFGPKVYTRRADKCMLFSGILRAHIKHQGTIRSNL